ncbi:unnamed protein product [Effrenium voratum]|uniref:Uncharacterized protein n=1 Tax=Effrenium voratum TaxID=2562239 RepID=A0AA36IT64_9DINO|nr:unnamed protein product [Effrenium voratum]
MWADEDENEIRYWDELRYRLYKEKEAFVASFQLENLQERQVKLVIFAMAGAPQP